MKVTYVFDEILPSTETDTEQVLNTASALARRGIDVELILPRRAGALPLSEQILLEYYQVKGPLRVRQLPARLTSVRPLEKAAHGLQASQLSLRTDVWYTRNLPALAAGLRAGHRVAYEHYRPWGDQYPVLEPILRRLMLHPRFLGAILHSEHSRESYERIGIPPGRLTVAHNGYDPTRFRTELTRAAARAELGLAVPGPMAVYGGHINERKGLDVVLRMAELAPEITFVLVGSRGRGPIEILAERHANVRIVPWQKFDRTAIYQQASDFLLIPPSLSPLEEHGSTVLPMKVFTYLASGRVIVAPIAPDTAELLRDGENALLVMPGDAEAAVRGMRRLLADSAAWDRVARGALATAAGLTWDARAERVESTLRRWLAADDVAIGGTPWSAVAWLARTGTWLGRRAHPARVR